MSSRATRATLAATLALLVASPARESRACGASSGSGVSASSCSLDEHAWETAPKSRFGLAFATTSTTLRFGSLHVDARREVVVATYDRRVSPRTTLQLGLGAVTGGWLDLDDARFELRPGLAASVGVMHRFVDAARARPFVLGGAQLAVLATSTRAPSGATQAYDASDLRFTGALGWTLGGRVSPYLVGRVFGGPIYWRLDGESKTGTDAYHVQLGAGAALTLGPLDVGLEGVPLGERGASVTVGASL